MRVNIEQIGLEKLMSDSQARKRGDGSHTASLEKRGPSGSRFTTLELYFYETMRIILTRACKATYTDE